MKEFQPGRFKIVVSWGCVKQLILFALWRRIGAKLADCISTGFKIYQKCPVFNELSGEFRSIAAFLKQ